MPDGDRPQRVCDVPWRHLQTEQFYTVIWPQIEPFIASGLRADPLDRYTARDVLQEIILGKVRLWVSFDSVAGKFEMAAVTSIVPSPQARECKIWVGGGRNMRAWLGEFMREVEAYARAEGCSYLTGGGRRGWTRVLPGWHQVGIEIAKRLE